MCIENKGKKMIERREQNKTAADDKQNIAEKLSLTDKKREIEKKKEIRFWLILFYYFFSF